MPSRILYDVETEEIVRCQPEPTGSAGMPCKWALCKSARIPQPQQSKMSTVDIDYEVLTSQAKNELRIIDGQVFDKPKVSLELDKKEVEHKEEINVKVSLTDTLESDDFEAVEFNIGEQQVELDIGENELIFEDEGEYSITLTDNRFKPMTSVQVVVDG